MDFESPDVEKDFPGLYASESGRKSNESDFSEGDHDKPSKKDLLGRRKDKKESKKDRGYAALEGESSPEEDTDTKSPSKSKKTKSFKFPTKSKEKREKSRDKEKVLDDSSKQKELNEREKKKEKEREKEREKEKREKEKREKLKEKDKEKEEKAKFKLESKEKLKDEKKEKIKDKDKDKLKEKDKIKDKDKNKKLTKIPSTFTSGVPFEEIFTLGVALPIFGVSLQHSVERSRCHDDTGLPLLVRDSIDYLQAHGLKSNLIYRAEPDKLKLQQLRKLYTDRESTFPYHWDVPVACAILKSFISELPESILTQELHGQFEQATAIAEPQREATMQSLIAKLPNCNHSILGWLMRHFESVVANEQNNNANVQTIATAMGPALNMSLNLLTYFIAKADKLFPEVDLSKYVPPLQSLPAEFPDSAQEISTELRKQESLLSQIHAEMHAGFITESRDHQLWEAQRIVTQLKRKLRSVQKSVEPNSLPQQPSIDEKPSEDEPECNNVQADEPISISSVHNDQDTPKPIINSIDAFPEVIESPQVNTEALFNHEPKFNAEPKFNSDVKFAETNFNSEPKFDEDPIFIPEPKFDADPIFNAELEDNFEFKPEVKGVTPEELETPTEVIDKPKLTEKELKVLRLELENAEYLQLKSLLQAKINSEQFEIVKLRSHVALKSKQEGNIHSTKEIKDYSPEELELRQKLLKENALLEQERLTLINQIFQERVACLHLKIELAMKEILSKS